MKKIILILFAAISITASAQNKKDTVVTDSTEIITISHLKQLMEFFMGTLTVNEYNKIQPAIERLAQMAVQEYKQKNKKSKPTK